MPKDTKVITGTLRRKKYRGLFQKAVTLKRPYIPLTKRIAYYTCYFGGSQSYSKLIPPVPSQTEDCYYFTNNHEIYAALESTRFIAIFVSNIPVENEAIKDCMNTKELRSCPHRFDVLKKYRYYCWFDSKLTVFEDRVNSAIEEIENSSKLMAFTKHSYSDRFTSVWDEYNLAIQYARYSQQSDMYRAYIERQLANGFSETISIHYCCGFSIRKNCRKVHEMGENWLHHIRQCGIEDQISFQFVIQTYGNYILPLEYQATWKYTHE